MPGILLGRHPSPGLLTGGVGLRGATPCPNRATQPPAALRSGAPAATTQPAATARHAPPGPPGPPGPAGSLRAVSSGPPGRLVPRARPSGWLVLRLQACPMVRCRTSAAVLCRSVNLLCRSVNLLCRSVNLGVFPVAAHQTCRILRRCANPGAPVHGRPRVPPARNARARLPSARASGRRRRRQASHSACGAAPARVQAALLCRLVPSAQSQYLPPHGLRGRSLPSQYLPPAANTETAH